MYARKSYDALLVIIISVNSCNPVVNMTVSLRIIQTHIVYYLARLAFVIAGRVILLCREFADER